MKYVDWSNIMVILLNRYQKLIGKQCAHKPTEDEGIRMLRENVNK